MASPVRVLFAASEIYPFVKTGGLGDVAGALPPALAAQGIDVCLMLPGYPALLEHLQETETVREPGPFFGSEKARILTGILPGGLRAYLLDIPRFYDRPNPYIDGEGRDWSDNHLRFAAFCHAAADPRNHPGWRPDIIHGNDWHCGLIPAYARLRPAPRPATILTIHNIAYQGIFPREILPETGLPEGMFCAEGAEYHGQLGFLKAGLSYADALTAVSPGYAQEIRTGAFGCGLEGLLQHRAESLSGILNGIDTETWNPATDAALTAPYDAVNLASKSANREALLRETGLRIADDRPLFSVVSRLVEQKGLDLLLEAAPRLLQEGAGLVLLGTGDEALEQGYLRLAAQWPEQVSVSLNYNEDFAHRIIAGADAVVIPSRFEPCGLVQLYALRYGTLPVVRRTGGLADTVTEKTGFLFGEPGADALAETLLRACGAFRRPKEWRKMQKEAMKQDFSWNAAAKNYARLYRKYKPRAASKTKDGSANAQRRNEAA